MLSHAEELQASPEHSPRLGCKWRSGAVITEILGGTYTMLTAVPSCPRLNFSSHRPGDTQQPPPSWRHEGLPTWACRLRAPTGQILENLQMETISLGNILLNFLQLTLKLTVETAAWCWRTPCVWRPLESRRGHEHHQPWRNWLQAPPWCLTNPNTQQGSTSHQERMLNHYTHCPLIFIF